MKTLQSEQLKQYRTPKSTIHELPTILSSRIPTWIPIKTL